MQIKTLGFSSYSFLFSTSLRELFEETQIIQEDETWRELIHIRDSIRQQAIIYAYQISPLTEKVMQLLSTFFDYHLILDYNDWLSSLGDILERLAYSREHWNVLCYLHGIIIIGLNQQMTAAKNELEKHEIKKEIAITEEGLNEGLTAEVENLSAEISSEPPPTAEEMTKITLTQALKLISDDIVPSIMGYKACLETLQKFVLSMEDKFKFMSTVGDDEANYNYFLTMKENAKTNSQLCIELNSVGNKMKVFLRCFSGQSSEKLSANEWIEKQIADVTEKKLCSKEIGQEILQILNDT